MRYPRCESDTPGQPTSSHQPANQWVIPNAATGIKKGVVAVLDGDVSKFRACVYYLTRLVGVQALQLAAGVVFSLVKGHGECSLGGVRTAAEQVSAAYSGVCGPLPPPATVQLLVPLMKLGNTEWPTHRDAMLPILLSTLARYVQSDAGRFEARVGEIAARRPIWPVRVRMIQWPFSLRV